MRRRRKQAHEKAAQALAIHQSGNWLASGGGDGQVHLFSFPKLELIQSFEGFGESVAELGFGPGEDFCVYALGRLGKVSAWPRKKKEPLFEGRVEKLNGQIASAAFYAEKECFALAQQSPFEKEHGTVGFEAVN